MEERGREGWRREEETEEGQREGEGKRERREGGREAGGAMRVDCDSQRARPSTDGRYLAYSLAPVPDSRL